MLKETSDGLSKAWKPVRTLESFFNGGKVDISSETGRLLSVYNEDLCIVDWTTGALQSRLLDIGDDEEGGERVTNFVMHPNGKEVVVAMNNFLLRHYRLDPKESVRSLRGHTMPVLCMAYDATGTLVATGSADRSVRVWDIGRGYCTHSFKEHTDIVQTVKFHPDPTRYQLFSCGEDCTLRVYDLIESSCVAVFREHMSLPTSLSFSADGYFMVSVGRDQVMNFYELRGRTHVKTIPIMDEMEGVLFLNQTHTTALLAALGAQSEQGKGKKRGRDDREADASNTHVVLTAGLKGMVRVLKITYNGRDASSFSSQELAQFSTLQSNVTPAAVSKGTASKLSDLSQSTLLSAISGLMYYPSLNSVIATTADNNICIFNITESTGLEASRHLIGSYDDILGVVTIPGSFSTIDAAASSYKYRAAVVSNSALIHVIDEDMRSSPLSGHSDIVLAVDASPDGKLLATSSKDHTVRLWDLSLMKCCGVASGHTEAVACVALSQRASNYTTNQAFAVSGAGDKILKRWTVPVKSIAAYKDISGSKFAGDEDSITTMLASHSVRAHDKDINTVAVSPNDSLVASGSQDNTIRIWRSSDLTPLATLSGHKRGVWHIAFSPVDRSLASASGDRTVRLWSLNDNTCLRTFQGHTASVLNVKFINHGLQLMSSGSDGLLNLWTISSGEIVETFDIHTDKVWGLSNVSDNLILSGGSDARLVLWKDVTAEVENERLEAEEKNLLLEQSLANDIRNKNYSKAFSTALSLGHTNKLITILSSVLDSDFEEGDDSALLASRVHSRVSRLNQYIEKLTDEELEKLIGYLVDWNTNARYSFVSQALIASLFSSIDLDRLQKLKKFVDAVPGLVAYSERHYQRLDRLHEATYLIEFISGQVGGLATVSA